MNRPRVSVCVPTIGRIDLIARTQAALSAQRFEDFEVLVLDNASDDEAKAQLDAWAEQDPRVRVLTVSERIPMFENFNRGFAAARGDVIAFCHDDDEVEPDWVAQLEAFFAAHPTVGILGSGYSLIDEQSRLIEVRRTATRDQVLSGRAYILRLLAEGRNPLAMQTVAYRASVVGREGIDTRLPIHYGDFVFLMRLAERCDVGMVAAPLMRVRAHDGQASRAMALSEGLPLRNALFRTYLAELEQRGTFGGAGLRLARLGCSLSQRTGALLGWAQAPDADEAAQCAALLGDRWSDQVAGRLLSAVGGVVSPGGAARTQAVRWASRLANRASAKGTG